MHELVDALDRDGCDVVVGEDRVLDCEVLRVLAWWWWLEYGAEFLLGVELVGVVEGEVESGLGEIEIAVDETGARERDPPALVSRAH